MIYHVVDITGSAGADPRQRTSQWLPRVHASTGGGIDLWRYLFTHGGTGSNMRAAPESHRYSERSSADNLRRALEVMNPSVKDLSSLFEMSRQTIYNWLNGDELKAEQASRLRALAAVADILAVENIAGRSKLLKRAGAEGAQSLWSIVKEGTDVVQLAKQLVQVAHGERAKMRKLNERFAHRRRDDDGSELIPRFDEAP